MFLGRGQEPRSPLDEKSRNPGNAYDRFARQSDRRLHCRQVCTLRCVLWWDVAFFQFTPSLTTCKRREGPSYLHFCLFTVVAKMAIPAPAIVTVRVDHASTGANGKRVFPCTVITDKSALAAKQLPPCFGHGFVPDGVYRLRYSVAVTLARYIDCRCPLHVGSCRLPEKDILQKSRTLLSSDAEAWRQRDDLQRFLQSLLVEPLEAWVRRGANSNAAGDRHDEAATTVTDISSLPHFLTGDALVQRLFRAVGLSGHQQQIDEVQREMELFISESARRCAGQAPGGLVSNSTAIIAQGWACVTSYFGKAPSSVASSVPTPLDDSRRQRVRTWEERSQHLEKTRRTLPSLREAYAKYMLDILAHSLADVVRDTGCSVESRIDALRRYTATRHTAVQRACPLELMCPRPPSPTISSSSDFDSARWLVESYDSFSRLENGLLVIVRRYDHAIAQLARVIGILNVSASITAPGGSSSSSSAPSNPAGVDDTTSSSTFPIAEIARVCDAVRNLPPEVVNGIFDQFDRDITRVTSACFAQHAADIQNQRMLSDVLLQQHGIVGTQRPVPPLR